MAIDLGGLLSGGAQLASAYIPYEATAGVMSDIQGIADTFVPAANELGQTAAEKAAFSPFAVRTSTGTTDIGAGGGLTQTLGETPQAIQSGLMGQAQSAVQGFGGGIPDYSGLSSDAANQAQSALGSLNTYDPSISAQQNAMNSMFASQMNMFGLPQATLGGVTSSALQGAQQGLLSSAPDVTGAYSGINAPNVANVSGAYSGINVNNPLNVSNVYGGIDTTGQRNVADIYSGIDTTGQRNVSDVYSDINTAKTNTQAGDAASEYYSAGSQALSQGSPTATSLYEQFRAMQSPEENRRRLELENRLAAQGRLGVTTSAYGGTPEQLALEKAQAEARNTASFQATQLADQLATSAQNRAQQLTSMGMSADQVQSQLNSEGFNQAMSLASGNLTAEQAQAQLDSQRFNEAMSLASGNLTAEQAQAQLDSQRFNEALSLASGNLTAKQAQSQLDSERFNQAMSLASGNLTAEQIQSQLDSGRFNQQMALAGGNISAQQVQSGLQSEQQNRASQLAQLGLTGTQASEALTTQQLNNLRGLQTGNIGASQAQQGLQAGNLGLSSGLFGLSSQAASAPSTMEAQQLANIQSLLGTSYIPQQQQLAALTPALQAANIAQAGGLGESEALYKAGMQGLQSQAEATGAVAGLEAQRARALGDALQGLFAIEAGQTESAAEASINSLLDLFGV
jgi:hypothetical protein